MGAGIAGQILGMVLGQGMQPINDDRQVDLQGRLGAQQVGNYRQMLEIQSQKEMEMWQKTNYSAQMEQMKKAGLNPALMYGMNGGGGQTTGGGAPTTNGGNAAGGGGQETVQYMGMGMQMAQLSLLEAQRKNIDADTQNKIEDSNLKGVQRENVGAGTGKINAEVEQISKQTELLTKTLQHQIQKIQGESESAWTRGKVDTTTVNEQIEQKINEAIQVSLKNINISQDTAQKIAMIAQGWKGLELDERKTKVQELIGGEQKDQDQIIGLINTIVGIVSKFIPVKHVAEKWIKYK